jgi:hypothetical protein
MMWTDSYLSLGFGQSVVVLQSTLKPALIFVFFSFSSNTAARCRRLPSTCVVDNDCWRPSAVVVP